MCGAHPALGAGGETTEQVAPGAVIVRSLSGDGKASLLRKGSGTPVMNLSLKTRIVPGGVLALALVAGSASPVLADFNYPDFSSIAGLSLNGASVQTTPTLAITPPVRASAGSFWRSDRQGIVNGFDTTFTFRVRDISGRGSDGFAFVVQNSAAGSAALGGRGGALGYATNEVFFASPGQQGIENCLAVEFDTYDNSGDWTDFTNGSHISVQTNGTADNRPSEGFSLGRYLTPSAFADSNVHTARIAYTPGSMDIYLDNLTVPVLSVAVNLGSLLNLSSGQSFVGFTAGTGAQVDVERHEINSWEFGSTIVPTPAAASLLATGGLLIGRRRRR